LGGQQYGKSRAITWEMALLGTKHPGRNEPLIEEARRKTAQVAVNLSPMVTVRWNDSGHAMVRTNPVDVARAITGL